MDRRIGGWMAAMAVGVGLTTAVPARAGTYTVHACGTPAGKFTNHSWTFTRNSGQISTADCAASDASPRMVMTSSADRAFAVGESASITFRAPAGATIADFRIDRYMQQFNPVDNYPGRRFLFDLGQLGTTPFELTGDHTASATPGVAWRGGGQAYEEQAVVTRASFGSLAGYAGDAGQLSYTIGCQPAEGCALGTNGVGAKASINLAILSASVTLNDPTKPTISDVRETGLRTPGAVGGDEPVTFDANDNSGIKSAQLVDVTDSGRPKVVGQRSFACDYSYAAPCPQAAGAQVAPSAALPAGPHQLQVRVTDAGGNVTDSGLFTINVGGPANGSAPDPQAKLTAAFARNKRGTLLVAFGRRATVRGRLTTAAGAPIANATIQVLDRELRTGTQYRQRLEVTTGADGGFSVLAGKGAARAIRFEYRWRRQLAQPDVARRVQLRVKAGATLSITPRRVRAGGRIRISGRLRGLPMPRSGKVVELQAFERGRWRDFRSTRARRSGRFSTSYRFLRAGSGASFLIRARVRRDDSYPYYLGYSPRVRVRVR